MTQGAGVCSALLNPRGTPRPQWGSLCFLLVELGGRQALSASRAVSCPGDVSPHLQDSEGRQRKEKLPKVLFEGTAMVQNKAQAQLL